MMDAVSWATASSELLLLGMACVIALFDLFVRTPLRGASFRLTQLTLAVVALLQANLGLQGVTMTGFGGMVVVDPMGAWLKCFATLALMLTLLYARPYAAAREMLRGGELFTLSLFALLGIFVMISGQHFLVIYLGLELLTLSSYALVALRRDDGRATEAAMKYFVLGALASGFLLYGLSLVYGATGSLHVTRVAELVAAGVDKPQVLMLGVVFVVAGLAFKLGVVPFHMWVPDIYHGAPTAITLFIAAAPKLAAFAIVVRLLAQGLPAVAADWQQMLAVVAVGSLIVGNLAAVAQRNIKRMLAFSTIAQMGFMLLALVGGMQGAERTGVADAYGAAMFYVVTYVLTTLATFGVLLVLTREGFESEAIEDFAGLNQRSPLYAGILAACMFSLAGVPPLVGFWAKLAVLEALLAAGGNAAIGLAIFAVLASLVGAFYYLRVVKVMYFDTPTQSAPIEASAGIRAAVSVNGLLVLLLGVVPGALLTLCVQAMRAVL
jgi:NADH-quinone oxidoreductase subunit N